VEHKGDIYDVVSDGTLQVKTAWWHHKFATHVFCNMEGLLLCTNSSVRRNHFLQRVVSTGILTLDMEDKTLGIFGYEGCGLLRTKVFDDIVGDLKIDALYI
jgi:hypothetical protein